MSIVDKHTYDFANLLRLTKMSYDFSHSRAIMTDLIKTSNKTSLDDKKNINDYINRCLELLESIATNRELESRLNNISLSTFIKQQLDKNQLDLRKRCEAVKTRQHAFQIDIMTRIDRLHQHCDDIDRNLKNHDIQFEELKINDDNNHVLFHNSN
jgi:hypothetical protein